MEAFWQRMGGEHEVFRILLRPECGDNGPRRGRDMLDSSDNTH